MPETAWLDDHIELFAIHALTPDETHRVQRELDDLPPMERSIFAGRVVETQTAMARYASAYALDAPTELRDSVLDRVFGAGGSEDTGRVAPVTPLTPSAPTDDTAQDTRTRRGTDPRVAGTDASGPAAPGAGAPGQSAAPADADRPDASHTDPGHTDAGEPAAVTSLDDARKRRRRRTVAMSTAAAILAVVALAGGILIGRGLTSEPSRPSAPPVAAAPNQPVLDVLDAPDARATTTQLSSGHGTMSVIASRSTNRAVALLRGANTALPNDRTYQLWLVGKASHPVSAGLVPGRSTPSRPTVVDGLDKSLVLAVTVEPAGGSPQPTTPILATVKL